MDYISDIINVLLVFPLIAAVLILPYAFIKYNRHGSVSKRNALIIYSFILYMLIAFFLISLPLPDWASIIGKRWQAHINLIPLKQIWFYWYNKTLNLANLKVYLVSMSLWQLLFNVLLTVPFGVYMCYCFNLSLKRTILCSFLLSLLYETSQITALFGVFPEPYRLADVEDLICNTMGGAIGWQIAYVFTSVLSNKYDNNAKCRIIGTRVRGICRFLSALIDYVCIIVLYIFILGVLRILSLNFTNCVIFGQVFSWSFFCVLSLIQVVLTKGSTLGHAICRIILVAKDGYIASTGQMVNRYLYLWLFTGLPMIIVGWLTSGQFTIHNNDCIFLTLIAVSKYYFVWYIINIVFRRGVLMPHDRLSGTQYMAIEMSENTD